MNDAGGVRGIQCVGDLDPERQEQLEIDPRPPGDALLQRGALQILHHDERAAVLLADVVNGADVGMIQRGRGSGLALKAI